MTWDEICRRAGGRRHYNGVRRFRAVLRLRKVAALMDRLGWFTHGVPSQVARELGVSRSTICRDLQSIEQADGMRAPGQRRATVPRNWPG